jgi:predicted acylesterase/phospholipase RssA
VLGGGQSLGAIQVSMLQASSEHEIVPNLVAGTAVGSLNGAALAPTSGGDRLFAAVVTIRRRARARRGRSLVEDVYEEVRSDTLFGRRPPSARLSLNEIVEQHGVSLRCRP